MAPLLKYRTLQLLALEVSLFSNLSTLTVYFRLDLDAWEEDENDFGDYETYEADVLRLLRSRNLRTLNLIMNSEWIETSASQALSPDASQAERERYSRRVGLKEYINADVLKVCRLNYCHLVVERANVYENQTYDCSEVEIFPDSARWDMYGG